VDKTCRATLKKSISDATQELAALEQHRRDIELVLSNHQEELASLDSAGAITSGSASPATPPRTTPEKSCALSPILQGTRRCLPKTLDQREDWQVGVCTCLRQ